MFLSGRHLRSFIWLGSAASSQSVSRSYSPYQEVLLAVLKELPSQGRPDK